MAFGQRRKVAGAGLVCLLAGALAGCGSASSAQPPGGGACPAAVEATTAEQIRVFSGAQVMALGTNIRCLSDAALGALSGNSAGGNGQIYAITPEQIGVLTPAQVRMLGATGEGGVVTTSKVAHLNAGTWGVLVAKMEQVAAITAAETRTLSPDQIKAMGANIEYLSDAALGALSGNSAGGNGQIYAITPEQIGVLTPAQVRMLGATGEGGVVTTSKVAHLNAGTWGVLVAKMEQVAAITAAETRTLSPDQIKAIGANIEHLSDAALGALSGNSAGGNGQIYAITPEQIGVLTPAQVRMLGATGEGGVVTTSKVAHLNAGTWGVLVAKMEQVAAITAAETRTLSPDQIKAMGANIKHLSDAALGALSGNSAGGTGQIYAITAEQVVVFSPAQIAVIAATNNDTGITHLNMGAFASLTAAQIAALTTAEKASLSAAQHTACAC